MRWRYAWVAAIATQGWFSTAEAIQAPSPGAATAQTLKLPDGPGSLKGLANDPSVDVFSGQVSYEVPIELPGARRDFKPNLALAYRGDLGNGALGVGWAVRQVAIHRSTRLGVPHFDATDELQLVGLGAAGRLVSAGDGTFRVEGRGNEIKIVPEAGGYRVFDADGTQYRLGESDAARQRDATHVLAWMVEDAVDVTGQRITYAYAQDRGQIYLSTVTWGPGSVYRAVFELADRPDVTTSRREGFAVTTGKRVAAVRVESFGQVLRRYELAYDQRFALSRLAGVRMTGRAGAGSLPALTFHYADTSQPQVVAMPGIEGWRLNAHGVSLVDVDGDGAEDLLRVEAGNHAYKKNLGGSFGASVAITGADAASLDQARLMDVEGHARPNLVTIVNNEWRPYRLTGTTWTALGSWAGTTGVPVLGSSIVLADLNGDGRVDAVQWSATSLSVRFGTTTGTTQGLSAPVSVPPIGGELFPGTDVYWNDINGDGLADVMYLAPGGIWVYYGVGNGTFLPRQQIAYPPGTETLPHDRFRFADLDRDGLLDLIVVSPTGVRCYAGRPTAAVFAPTPIALPGPEDAGDDVVVSVADANGNGSDDVVWSSPRGMWLLDLAGPTNAGMLIGVDNGMGKSLAIDYDASATLARRASDAGQPWSRLLQVSIPVATRTTMQLGGGDPARVTDFGVRDGFFDSTEYAFGGFLFGTQTAHGDTPARDLTTETTYNSGTSPNRVLRGRPVTVTRKSGDGKLFDATTYRWRAAQIGDLPTTDQLLKKAALVEEWTDHYEGTATPVRTHELYDLDDQARTVRETDDGRLDITGDERIVERSFGSDATTWVRDRLCEEWVKTSAGAIVSDTRTYYGDDTATLALCAVGRGYPKRVDGWLADSARWVTLEQTEYDALGNMTSQRKDGVARTYGYDANGLRVVRESVVPSTGVELAWTATWDDVQGVPIAVTDPAGATTRLAYDPLGRLASQAIGTASPHAYFAYDWERARPRSTVFRYDRSSSTLPASLPAWSAGAGWRETMRIMNGNGELVTAATRLDDSQWIVDELRVRDARGAVTFRSEPFASATADPPEALPAGTSGTTVAYDALDRAIGETMPNGALRHTTYGVYTVRVDTTDLATITSLRDGHDRVIHTERALASSVEATDTRYDAAGRVTSITTGPVTQTFGYDTLGRFVSGSDPDAGARTLVYDDAGRLVDYANASGQHASFSYDGAGRLLEQRLDGISALRFHYDVPRTGATSFQLGRLAWAEDPEGTVDVAYDPAGRTTLQHRTIRGVAADEARAYAPSGLMLHVGYDDGVAYDYTYDSAGRAIAIPGVWQALGLDAAGRVLDEQFGNGVVQHDELDALGFPKRIRVGTFYDATATRTSFGALATVADTDGVGLHHDASFGYDLAGRLTHATIGVAPGASQFDYAYDSLQNMVSRVASGPTGMGGLYGTYRYGEAGASPRQLTSIANGAATTSFRYDPAGRQIAEAGKAFAFNALDQLTAVTSGGAATVHSYGWDGERALTQEPDGTLWRWFSTSTVQRGSTRDHYVGLGDRVIARIRASSGTATGGSPVAGSVVRVLPPLFGGAALLLALSSLAAARGRRRFAGASATSLVLAGQLTSCAPSLHGGEQDAIAGGQALYFHATFAVGPTLFTDDTGALVEERRFEPFGASIGTVDYQREPTSMLGKPIDPATGLSFHGARWYEPDTARWLTPDPPTRTPDPKFAVAPWDLHPYIYVRQNPVSYWDPDGRDPAPSEGRSYSWASWYVDHLDPSRGSTPVRVLKGITLTVTAPVVGALALGQHAAYEVDDYVVSPVVSGAEHVWGWIKPTPIVFFQDPQPMNTVGDYEPNEEISTHTVAYSHEDPIHVAPAPAPKPHHHHHHHATHHPAAPPAPDLTPGVQPTGPIYMQDEHGGPAASEQSHQTAPCKVPCTMM